MKHANTARAETETPERSPRPPERLFAERLRAHDPRALERFFETYFEPLYARVRQLLGNAQEAEDLTQDIFLAIHRALPRFDPERRLEPWVYSIAMNRIRDHWRARRVLSHSDATDDLADWEDGCPEPPRELEQRESERALEQAIRSLPSGMRTVLALRVYESLTFDAIARSMKLTPQAARKRYSRAVQLLRKSLVVEGAAA